MCLTRTDKEHFSRTFPPKVVIGLSCAILASSVMALSAQIVLMAKVGDVGRLASNAINAAPGVWAGTAAAIAACLGILAILKISLKRAPFNRDFISSRLP